MDFTTVPPPSSTRGTLHFVPPNLSAFEISRTSTSTANSDPSSNDDAEFNTLIWIGGMFDTYASVSYPFQLAEALVPQSPWSIVTTALTSAGLSWGVCSAVDDDANDLARIVAFFRARRPGRRIVLMGHSTGCQDCMAYVLDQGLSAFTPPSSSEGEPDSSPDAKSELPTARPPVDGIILQAPVSDRQALDQFLPATIRTEADTLAAKWVREGHGADALPNRLTAPAFGRIAITAKRWLAISSPGPDHAGEDDFFSSDLPDARLRETFGQVGAPLLILYGGADEAAPEGVDMASVVRNWTDLVKSGHAGGRVDDVNGGILPGASHNLNDSPEDVRRDLVRRVLGFLGRLDRGEFEG